MRPIHPGASCRETAWCGVCNSGPGNCGTITCSRSSLVCMYWITESMFFSSRRLGTPSTNGLWHSQAPHGAHEEGDSSVAVNLLPTIGHALLGLLHVLIPAVGCALSFLLHVLIPAVGYALSFLLGISRNSIGVFLSAIFMMILRFSISTVLIRPSVVLILSHRTHLRVSCFPGHPSRSYSPCLLSSYGLFVVLVCPSRSARLCFSSCVRSPASLLASASDSLRERRTHTIFAVCGLGFGKVLADSTSCSLVHVLTHVLFSARSLTCCSSARTFTCCAWSGGLPAPLLLLPRASHAEGVSPELGCSGSSRSRRHPSWSALAQGLSVDAIVLCVHFRSASSS